MCFWKVIYQHKRYYIKYTLDIKPLLQQVPVFIKTILAALGSATNRFQAIGDRAYTNDKMRYTAMLRRETS